MSTNADRIRIAIALAAVKYKPSHQSFPSYVLDLRATFQPSTPLAPTTDGSWRTHALSIERNYAELQIKYDAEKIKVLAIASSASTVPPPVSTMVLEQSNSATVKRKAKKKTSATMSTSLLDKQNFDRIDLKSALEGLHDRMIIPTFPEPDSLFSALNDLLLVTSVSVAEPALLLSVATRTIETLAKPLERIVAHQSVNVLTDIDVLETLSTLLHHVLHQVLPLLASFPQHQTNAMADLQEPVTVLLERLTILVFNRLIQAFSPLSETYLNALFLPPIANAIKHIHTGPKQPILASTQPSPVDIRVDVLSFFRNMFSLIHGQIAMPKLAVVIRTLQASLILEAVREIEGLLVPVPARALCSDSEVYSDTTVKPQDSGPETTERVKKLAMKDTFWYLCTILHTLLSESSVLDSSPSLPDAARINHRDVEDQDEAGKVRAHGGADKLLKEGISDALLKLIQSCRKRVSSCCHGYLGTEGGIHYTLDGDRDRVGNVKDSHVWGNDTEGKEKNEEALDLFGNGGAVTACINSHVDPGVSASPRPMGEGSDQCYMISMPQLADETFQDRGDHEITDLDEVSYEMLLGVMERYWVWSKS